MTYSELRPLWWSMFWRFVLVAFVSAIGLGALFGIAFGLAGFPQFAPLAGLLCGFLVQIPVSMWALRAALLKHSFLEKKMAEQF